jgi:hypothetical protein
MKKEKKEGKEEQTSRCPEYGTLLRDAFERLLVNKRKGVKKLSMQAASKWLEISHHTLLHIFRGEYEDRYFPAMYLDIESRATAEEKKEELLKLYEARKRDFERRERRIFRVIAHIFTPRL